jgi:hypothetical protein
MEANRPKWSDMPQERVWVVEEFVEVFETVEEAGQYIKTAKRPLSIREVVLYRESDEPFSLDAARDHLKQPKVWPAWAAPLPASDAKEGG